MSIYTLLTETIIKIQQIKLNAPIINLEIADYLCKQSYCDLFKMMFVTDLRKKLIFHDIEIYNNYLYKYCLGDFRIFKVDENYKLTGYSHIGLIYIDNLQKSTQNYIEKLCKIILNNNYNIFDETEDIIIYYWCILHFIPIYFSITNNIYDIDKTIIKELNINIDTIPHFLKYMIEFKNYNKDKLLNMAKIINKNKIDVSKYFKEEEIVIQPIPIAETPIDTRNNINNNIKIRRKTPIPKNIRSLVWNKYIGEINGIGECYVCTCKISSQHFECGHIIAQVDGGTNTIDNLRPICSLCNKSIGSKNMNDFKSIYIKK